MKWINVYCLICISLCATLLTKKVYANDPLIEHANALFKLGSYFEASIEYERVIYFSESPRTRVVANLNKARALKQLGEFDKARHDLQRSLLFRGDDSLRIEVLYQIAFCAYMSDRPAEAHAMLLQLRNSFGGLVCQKLFLLEALVKTDLQQWEKLREHLLHWMGEVSASNEQKTAIITQYDNLFSDKGKGLSKDPDRARLWSTFIPGAGQLYAGEPGWAILNVVSQFAGLAGFGLLAYNGFYIASFVAGLGPFQSFYFGGIKQAHELTVNNNKSRMDDLQTALKVFLFDVASYFAE